MMIAAILAYAIVAFTCNGRAYLKLASHTCRGLGPGDARLVARSRAPWRHGFPVCFRAHCSGLSARGQPT